LEDSKLKNIIGLLNTDKVKDFSLGVDDILRFKNRICIPEDNELKQNKQCYLKVIKANSIYILE